MQIITQKGTNNSCYEDSLKLRIETFVKEQNVPLELEVDGLDDECFHLVGYVEDTPVASCRLNILNDTTIKIQRFCVQKAFRKKSYGRKLIQAVEEFARNNNYKKLVLGAQDQAQAFYEKSGFKVMDPNGYLDAGIIHFDMTKDL